MAWYRRAAAGLLVALSLVALATIGYSSASGLVSSSAYNYQYCTTPSQYQYCSTSTRTTSTKPGKGCGDKNHLHDRKSECKVVISDMSAKEGKAGTSTLFAFTVTLSDKPLSPVTVSYL